MNEPVLTSREIVRQDVEGSVGFVWGTIKGASTEEISQYP